MSTAGEHTPPAEARWVRCPSCGGEALYAPENPFRPFCTPVCKNIDFGAWASEEFTVEAKPSSEDEQD
jgi:endogenous inhibitor of DNA gyrase (YacG/DUF329 family)